MTRIAKLPIDQWSADYRARLTDDTTPFDRSMLGAMANAPQFAAAFGGIRAAMFQHTTLPMRLLELVRLRIAFHNQCRTCIAVRHQSAIDEGLTENDVCSLEKPLEAPNLSAAEKAAVAYADICSTNHFAINDATFEGLREHFTEAQLIELGMFVAFYIGFGRMVASWDIVEDLPTSFQDKSNKAAPWTHESFVLNDTKHANPLAAE